MKALSPAVNSSVNVLGYYARGDGGGGTFYWDATSTATDNGGTIIKAAPTTGRWIRVYSGAVNVLWFGAIRYGGHPEAIAGVGCSAIIQSIITLLTGGPDLSGGTIYFPTGVYGIDATITLASGQNSVKFVGDNMSAKSVLRTQTDITLLSTNQVWGLEIEGLVLAGFQDGVNNVVNLSSSFLCHIHNTFIEKANLAYGLQLTLSSNVSVTDCNFESGNGINVLTGSQNVIVSGCEIQPNYEYGIRTTATFPVTLTGNTFTCPTDITYAVFVAGASSSISMTGGAMNMRSSTTSTAIQIENAQLSTITGVSFYNGNRGVYIHNGAANVVVNACNFDTFTAFGAGVSNTWAGNGNIFVGNTYDNCTADTSGTSDGVKLSIITNSSPFIVSPTATKVLLKNDNANIAGLTSSAGISLVDDTAVSRTLDSVRAFALITSNSADYALVMLNYDTIVDISSSANLDVITSNGTLVGTTGVDVKVSIRMNNGTFYIENRLGVTRYFNIVLLAGINA
jgi:hypothetical protein